MVSFKEIVSWLKKLPEFLWTEPQKQDTKIRHLSYNHEVHPIDKTQKESP